MASGRYGLLPCTPWQEMGFVISDLLASTHHLKTFKISQVANRKKQGGGRLLHNLHQTAAVCMGGGSPHAFHYQDTLEDHAVILLVSHEPFEP